MPNISVGFIGSGIMAEAIARGLLQSGTCTPSSLISSDVLENRLLLFKEQLQVAVTEDNNQVVEQSDYIVLSVKPQDAAQVLKNLSAFPESKVLVSIVAGKTTAWIEKQLKHVADKVRVVRVMPNTPTLIRCGAAAVCKGANATQQDVDVVIRLLSSCNPYITQVPEDQLDAVTAVSGSGPAYVFYLIEGLIQAGIDQGLDEQNAWGLAVQTVTGAAKLVSESGEKPEKLRQNVTSKGGTTQAALAHLEANHWKEIFVEAVQKAAERSKELGRMN